MTKVAIVPVATENGNVVYNAVSGSKQTSGKTAGEALDALTAQLHDPEDGTLVIVQNQRADRFFTGAQQKRLQTLMGRWEAARNTGKSLPEKEQTELEALVEAELQASKDRSLALINELKKWFCGFQNTSDTNG